MVIIDSAVLGGIVSAAVGMIGMIIHKTKCYMKKNGKRTYGIGFTDKNIFDDEDDIEIKQIEMNGVQLLYVGKKRHEEVVKTPPPTEKKGLLLEEN